jgi:glycosyltransferase involved in cell wall biosynthesis
VKVEASRGGEVDGRGSGDAPRPKVSVLILAFDHERFIADAIESALAQRTDFPVEIVIAEDCSRDGTRAIVETFARRHPDRVRPLLRATNLGMMRNFLSALAACRGEYIALLEGDDRWTCEDKIAVQVALLDAHPECSASFHDVEVVDVDGTAPPRRFHPQGMPARAQLVDILRRPNFISTCSTVFRSGAHGVLGDWLYEMPMGDWPLHVLNARFGPYAYIDRVMGVYNVHAGGIWTSASDVDAQLRWLSAIERLDAALDRAHTRDLDRLRSHTLLKLARARLARGELRDAWTSARQAVRRTPSRLRAWSTLLRIAAASLSPKRGNPASARDSRAAL